MHIYLLMSESKYYHFIQLNLWHDMRIIQESGLAGLEKERKKERNGIAFHLHGIKVKRVPGIRLWRCSTTCESEIQARENQKCFCDLRWWWHGKIQFIHSHAYLLCKIAEETRSPLTPLTRLLYKIEDPRERRTLTVRLHLKAKSIYTQKNSFICHPKES